MKQSNLLRLEIFLQKQHKKEFEKIWAQALDIASPAEKSDLGDGCSETNFDSAEGVRWIVELAPAASPIITGVLGYLIAARGEITVMSGGVKIVAKGARPDAVKEIYKLVHQIQEANIKK